MTGARAARSLGLLAGAVLSLSGCFGPAPEAPRAMARPAVRPAPAPGRSAERGYVVQPGDTFRAIATRLAVDMADLGAINGIPSPYVVRVGQVLRVPLPRRLEPGFSRPTAMPTAPPPPPVTAEAPRLAWPTDGAIAARFGVTVDGRPNKGIDLAAYRGLAVRAAAAGRVIFAGHEPERFGQLVVIDHGGGWATAYAYLGELSVREGSSVRRGDRIARIGDSGAARTPTLHFELRRDNVAVDPAPFLPPRL